VSRSVEAYGYCPRCRTTRGFSREKSLYGYTDCKCGQRTQSCLWLPLEPEPELEPTACTCAEHTHRDERAALCGHVSQCPRFPENFGRCH
jgi:hypothetical protein